MKHKTSKTPASQPTSEQDPKQIAVLGLGIIIAAVRERIGKQRAELKSLTSRLRASRRGNRRMAF